MAAGKFKIYEFAKKYIGDGTFDLDATSNWKAALFDNSSNCNTLSVGTGVFGDLTGELAGINGYTSGGLSITNVTWTKAGGTMTFNCDDIVISASGGAIQPRYIVLYKDSTVNSIVKPLLCVCLLDVTPADIVISNGVTMTFEIDANGVFTLSGADVD